MVIARNLVPPNRALNTFIYLMGLLYNIKLLENLYLFAFYALVSFVYFIFLLIFLGVIVTNLFPCHRGKTTSLNTTIRRRCPPPELVSRGKSITRRFDRRYPFRSPDYPNQTGSVTRRTGLSRHPVSRCAPFFHLSRLDT